MSDDEDKAWAEHEQAERDRVRKELNEEKERRLRSLGLRAPSPGPQCIHCGQFIGAGSTGEEYGVCQNCMD